MRHMPGILSILLFCCLLMAALWNGYPEIGTPNSSNEEKDFMLDGVLYQQNGIIYWTESKPIRQCECGGDTQ